MTKVMITGAAGFIGGFLTKQCVDAGCSVLGFGISEPTVPYTSEELTTRMRGGRSKVAAAAQRFSVPTTFTSVVSAGSSQERMTLACAARWHIASGAAATSAVRKASASLTSVASGRASASSPDSSR